MASNYINALAAQKAANKTLVLVIVLQALLCALALWGWNSAPRKLTVHVPPDLRNGAHIRLGEVPPANVYAFAFYVWQQVNRWSQDGEKDYGLAIFKTAPYLTPECRETLQRDMNKKASAGELSMRVRALMELTGRVYEEARVTPLGNATWRVLLDTEVIETVRGVPVKSVYVRYPLRVVQFDGDRDANPFGLAIDCWPHDEVPTRIDVKAGQQATTATHAGGSMAPGRASELQNALMRSERQ